MKNIDLFVNKLLNQPISLSEKFHSKTKINEINKKNKPKLIPESWKTVYYKGYIRLEKVDLPAPKIETQKKIADIFNERKSERKFSNKSINKKLISTLIYYSAGVKELTLKTASRFYPSAGGRYPLETYLISINTQLGKGIFHYYPKSHYLERLSRLSNNLDLKKIFPNNDWIIQAPLIIIVTALFKRTTIKYGDRGYRNILIEAGHMGQNIYLLSSILNLNCCALGGFIDDKINFLLDLDGVEESVVYAFALGNKI
ncbi:SagB/ThcOx family dehydrogenase [Candidatus Beckwithbacteria bacterium]|nr:SagB/ThcOx family dehydrogenase [Candidatus Beckwithbacteria bacterium]